MGLKDYIDYGKNMWSLKWSQESPSARAGWTLSLLLGLSHIGSLSETIAKLKGFFRDGFVFYHQVVSEPLSERFLELGLRAAPETVDSIVIFGLLTFAFVWMRGVGRKNNLKGDRRIIHHILVGIFLIILLLSSGFPDGGLLWAFVIALLIMPVQLDIEQKKAFYIPIFCTVFAVCTIAAIKVGLSG